MSKIYFLNRICILILLIGHYPVIPAEEKILPLPLPPEPIEQISSADIILSGSILRNRTYRIGKYNMVQSVIRCKSMLKNSVFFPVRSNEEFTLTYIRKPDEWGPDFRDPLEPGEYVFFLSLKNVEIRKKIIGVVPVLMFPNRFSVSPGDGRIPEIVKILKK